MIDFCKILWDFKVYILTVSFNLQRRQIENSSKDKQLMEKTNKCLFIFSWNLLIVKSLEIICA